MREISQAKVGDLTDSDGASKRLTERFGRNFGVDSVHQLVKQGKLRAFIFQQGEMVERTAETQSRGKDLFFLRSDVEDVPAPRKPGRRWHYEHASS